MGKHFNNLNSVSSDDNDELLKKVSENAGTGEGLNPPPPPPSDESEGEGGNAGSQETENEDGTDNPPEEKEEEETVEEFTGQDKSFYVHFDIHRRLEIPATSEKEAIEKAGEMKLSEFLDRNNTTAWEIK